MSKTISIIGCGWLGLPMGIFLVEKGFEVKGSTTRKEKLSLLKENRIVPFLIKAGENLEGENIDSFFQSEILFINIPPGRRSPNVKKSHPKEIKNIIEKASSGDVEKIIFICSTAVYGNSNKLVTEKETPKPITPSGKALVKIENFLQTVNRFETTILRMAGLVGEDRKAGRFLVGKKNVQNGSAPVNLVHRDDCIRVIDQIIEQGHWNEVFNVCSDEHPSRRAFYIQQAKKQGFEVPEFIENDEPSFKIVSNEKLKSKLGYTFLFPDPMSF